MSTTCPDALLSTLVNNIRQACEEHVTFDDFTSVSGLICFDIDGSKQQCFVISELLRKRSSGEGHSAHLKTLNWQNIDRKGSFVWRTGKKWPPQAETQQHKTNAETDSCKSQCNGPSGPQGSLCANLSAKLDWCNRTFTLKPPECDASTSANPERNFSTLTITVSKDSQKSSPSSSRKDTVQGAFKENVHQGNRWSKRSAYKSNMCIQNCYPALPKKPVKRSKPYRHEKVFEKHSKTCSKEGGLERTTTYTQKEMYNCPSEKPTALSWFETVISPSSSLESIDSIQPFYLIPQSEPTSQPPCCEKGDNQTFIGQSQVTQSDHAKMLSGIPAQQSQSKKEAEELVTPQVEMCSPVRSNAPHTTFSNGTLNTVSSLENDGRITVKDRSPERSTWEVRGEKSNTTPSPHTIAGNVASECSTTSKKRASLLKWMGLFKKVHKTSSNVPVPKGIGKVQSATTNRKQGGVKARAYSLEEPPIEIRLKQWN